MRSAPERLVLAVETLAPRARDHVLEVGCGSGVAAELLLAQHPKVTLTAIDRSATAIAASKKRLAPFVEAGRVSVVRSELVQFSPQDRFHRAFAINVNAFWTDAEENLRALGRLLAPGGALVLVFEPPSAKQLAGIAASCTEHLREQRCARVTLTQRENLLAIRALRQR